MLWLLLAVPGLVGAGEELQEGGGGPGDGWLEQRVRAAMSRPGFSVEELPEHSRETRPSACPGVTEELVQRRLDITTEAGQAAAVLVTHVVVADPVINTVNMINQQRPWQTGSVFVRPSLNCLQQDDPVSPTVLPLVNCIKTTSLFFFISVPQSGKKNLELSSIQAQL